MVNHSNYHLLGCYLRVATAGTLSPGTKSDHDGWALGLKLRKDPTKDHWCQRRFFSTATSPVASGTHQKKCDLCEYSQRIVSPPNENK